MKKDMKIRVMSDVNPTCPVGYETTITDVDSVNEIAWVNDEKGDAQWFGFDEIEEVK